MKFLSHFPLISLSLMSLTVAAEDGPFSEHTNARSFYIQGGVINAFNGSIREDMLGLEYRHRKFSKWGLVPAIGYLQSDSGARYLYGDIKYTFELSPHWGLLISTGLGLYDDSPLIDLGYTLEIKSGIELFYQFDNNHRLGLSGNHYSNSNLGDTNPGTESVTVGYTIPF